MKKIITALKLMAVLPLALALLSCNPIENETDSASMLIVENLLGQDLEGNDANYLESDVLVEDLEAGTATITADPAIATLSARLLDPLSITGPSHLNSVTVTKYVVSYMRSDGRNTEGVDIPYGFEGQLSASIDIGSAIDVAFTIVRAAAKAEPPLVNLAEGRDAGVLTVHARVDFYGHDQTGRNVKATGYLTIHFANYVNEN
jgi:hypothetical protein